MTFSDSESNAEVASSRIKIGESFNIALAIAILCLCPPDNKTPSSPARVSYPSDIALINSSAFAFLAAVLIRSISISGNPYEILFEIVSLNKVMF